jgi:DNA repair protein RadC
MAELKISEMPQDDRPREKLTKRGAEALTNAELIAILLRTGLRGANAVQVASKLLQRFGSLGDLSRCTAEEIAQTPGIGPVKALELVATFKLGQRLAAETISRQKIDTPELVNALLSEEMRALHKESLRVLLLDTRINFFGWRKSPRQREREHRTSARRLSSRDHLVSLRGDRRP